MLIIIIIFFQLKYLCQQIFNNNELTALLELNVSKVIVLLEFIDLFKDLPPIYSGEDSQPHCYLLC